MAWLNQKLCLLGLVVLVGVGVWPVHAAAQAAQKPLTKAEILQLLEGEVPAARVAALARQHGINFPMTPANESELKQAGAAEELLQTLREIAPKPPAAPVLEILAVPGGAQVYVDDSPVARTSAEGHLRISTLTAGSHRVRLSAEDCDDYEATVSLTEDKTVLVTAALAPHAATLLAIQSTPGQAQVYVDDAFSGQTSEKGTLNVPKLAPGSHRVRVTHDGYHDDERPIELVAGRTVQVSAVLAKIDIPANPTVSSPSAPPATQTIRVAYKAGSLSYADGTLTIANGTMSYQSDKGNHAFSFALADVGRAFETLGDLSTRHDLHIVLKSGKTHELILLEGAGHGRLAAQFVTQMITLIGQAQGRK